MSHLSDHADAAIAALGHKASQAGTATTFVGWALSSQGTAIIGILIGITGLLVQWHYRRKQDRREQEEHDKRMALLE